MSRKRKTSERGYGAQHQRERARALALLRDGEPCALCGRPMYRADALDLDHSTPLVLGGRGPRRLTHRSCNRSAGARLGNARRRNRDARPPTTPPPDFTNDRW